MSSDGIKVYGWSSMTRKGARNRIRIVKQTCSRMMSVLISGMCYVHIPYLACKAVVQGRGFRSRWCIPRCGASLALIRQVKIASPRNQHSDRGPSSSLVYCIILPLLLVWEIEANLTRLKRSSPRHDRKRTLTPVSQDAEHGQVMLGRRSMHKKYQKECTLNSVSEAAQGTPRASRVMTMMQSWISGSRKAVDDTTSHGVHESTCVAIA